jgi:hypothetical protein
VDSRKSPMLTDEALQAAEEAAFDRHAASYTAQQLDAFLGAQDLEALVEVGARALAGGRGVGTKPAALDRARAAAVVYALVVGIGDEE